jgi:hypothetical protein
MTSITIDDFRSRLKAFDDPQAYPDAEIEPWLTLSDIMFNDNIWLTLKPIGQALFVAHNLVLAARDKRATDRGGIPGQSGSGILSSKSIGGVSASYDVGSGLEQGAGYYNLTTFGTRLYRMFGLVGMGGRQLGGPDINLGPTFGPAWPGVIPPPYRRP